MMFQHVADCSCAHSSNNIIGFYISLSLLDVLILCNQHEGMKSVHAYFIYT